MLFRSSSDSVNDEEKEIKNERQQERITVDTAVEPSPSSKEEEIARLEEQLKKLKSEQAAAGRNVGSEEEGPTPLSAIAVSPTTQAENTSSEGGEQKATLFSSVASVSTIEEETKESVSIDMFLSEDWKEADKNIDDSNTEEGGGGLIVNGLKAIGALAALLVFSKIPIGQEDLSKYSSIKSGPPTTTIDLG